MASIRKRKRGYQVQIRRQGTPALTKTFSDLKSARLWAAKIEAGSLDVAEVPGVLRSSSVCLSELLERYVDEYVPSMRSPESERNRALLVARQLGKVRAQDVSGPFLADYRKRRLLSVGPQTVKHEISLIRRVLKVANAEWGLRLPHGLPVVRMPRVPSGRTRRISPAEQAQIEAGLSELSRLVFRFALLTAMRRGEILGLTVSQVDFDRGVVKLPLTKTGNPRVVPLCPAALAILRVRVVLGSELLFPIQPNTVSEGFLGACRRAGISDCRFHDSRHEAISRFFERGLTVPQVALISGHKDYRMLARYTHLSEIELAQFLGTSGVPATTERPNK